MPPRRHAARMKLFLFCLSLLGVSASFADVVPWPIVQGRLSGHVHPSLARTKDGTLVVVFQGKGVLMRSRLKKGAENWEAARPIPGTDWRPPYIPKTPHVEIYPCSLDRLPDDRLLVTWNYIGADKAKDYYARPLVASLSADAGLTWSKPVILGPFGKIDLGAMRHSMLPLTKSRWLLPLRKIAPVVFDEKTKKLEPFPIKTADGKSHVAVQIIRTTKGTLLAMAPDLMRSTDGGQLWQRVPKFPGIAKGDNAQGRYLTPLDDGRVVLTWGVGTDNKGIRYNVTADDGQTWGATRHVLKENDVTARYGSPRTVQLGKNKIGTVYFNRFGLYLIRVTLN
jgi:hypothetical protein